MLKKTVLTLVVVGALGAGAYGLYQLDRETPADNATADSGNPSSSPLTGPIAELPEQVAVDLVVDDGNGTPLTYATTVAGGETAFEVLQTAAAENSFTVEYSDSEYGVFITSIGGVASDAVGARYWVWYLNEASANAAMDQVVVSDGDVVKVSYESLQ